MTAGRVRGFVRRLVPGSCGLALGLLTFWAAQAQTAQDPSKLLAPPPGLPLTAPTSAETPQALQTGAQAAPKPDELPEAITRQRQALAAQRSAIVQAEEAQQLACWQKFAVNACLSDARRARRQALEPLRQQELALNAQERLWRTEQRERRLQGKQADTRETP
jgi:hypothetical protein